MRLVFDGLFMPPRIYGIFKLSINRILPFLKVKKIFRFSKAMNSKDLKNKKITKNQKKKLNFHRSETQLV